VQSGEGVGSCLVPREDERGNDERRGETEAIAVAVDIAVAVAVAVAVGIAVFAVVVVVVVVVVVIVIVIVVEGFIGGGLCSFQRNNGARQLMKLSNS
jgi:uncharacterized membrane protein